MTNQIIHVAVHDLNRIAGGGFSVKLGPEKLAVTATTQRVVDEMYMIYARRGSKTHGKFVVEEVQCPTERHLRAYVGGKSQDFQTLTSSMMQTLAKQAGLRQAATGGHVFFSHFVRDERHYLLVAIVNDKVGAALTKKLEVTDTEYLDIEGFRFAGRINMSAWSNSEDRYIGFLKGKGDVAEYFQEFLGCDEAIQEKRDTIDLVQALKEFTSDQKMEGITKETFLTRAKEFCEGASKAKQELQFAALANYLMPEAPETLLNVLTDPEKKLNDGFVPNRVALGPLVRWKAKTPLWTIELEREALATGKVKFNEADNTLTLTELPPEFARELREETVPK